MTTTPTSRLSYLVLGAVVAASLTACGGAQQASPAVAVTAQAATTSGEAAGTTGSDPAAPTRSHDTSTRHTSTNETSTRTASAQPSTRTASAQPSTRTASAQPSTTARTTTAPAEEDESAMHAGSDRVIVLGSSEGGTNAQGFGWSQPNRVSLGGDPTGQVSSITWTSWGADEATATGTASYVAPGTSVAESTAAPVAIRAWDPGTCNGKLAYRKLSWTFTGKTENAKSDVIEACGR